MPQITSILGNEPGIQYQGVTDKTGSTGSASINNILIGKFKRGRLDRPMTITKANIRGMLGFDPKNLDYVAVQDALDTNIPSIQVLRVNGEPINNGNTGNNGDTVIPIGCANATSRMGAQILSDGGTYFLYVNDDQFSNTRIFRGDDFKNYLMNVHGVVLTAVDAAWQPVANVNGYYNGAQGARFENTSDKYVRIRIEIVDASEPSTFEIPANPSASYIAQNDNGYPYLSFCLAPAS
jgi:hypothetical protein